MLQGNFITYFALYKPLKQCNNNFRMSAVWQYSIKDNTMVDSMDWTQGH